MRNKGGNGRRWFLFAALAVIGFFVTACAAMRQPQAYHSVVMKGSIVHATEESVYLCIGTKDGAAVGQELNVYKVSLSGRPRALTFTREKVGRVRITAIIDDHFATAKIISGRAQLSDIVELER